MALEVLGNQYFWLCLDQLKRHAPDRAGSYWREVVRLSPGVLSHPESLAPIIVRWTVEQAAEAPGDVLRSILEALATLAPGLSWPRRADLGRLLIAEGLRVAEKEQWAESARLLLAGLRYHPLGLRPKAIAGRWLRLWPLPPDIYRGLHFASDAGGRAAARELYQDIAAKLGAGLQTVRPIQTGGAEEEVYQVRLGDQPYILRLLNPAVCEVRLAVMTRLQRSRIGMPGLIAASDSEWSKTRRAWLLEEWKPGVRQSQIQLTPAQELGVAAQLGLFLRQLHQVPMPGYGAICSADLQTEHPSLEAWLGAERLALTAEGLIDQLPWAAQCRVAEALEKLAHQKPVTAVLCHGDLNRNNVLISDGRLSAVIDCGDSVGGDPAYDFAITLVRFETHWPFDRAVGFVQAMVRAYQALDPTLFWDRIQAYRLLIAARELGRVAAVNSALAILLGAAEVV